MDHLAPRHIQNFSDGSTQVYYWGYGPRVVPCTSDAGTCEYLDAVYEGHETGLIYIGIFWSSIAALLLIWAFVRQLNHTSSTHAVSLALSSPDESEDDHEAAVNSRRRTTPFLTRVSSASHAWLNRHLLKRNPLPFLFGGASRLQVTILAILVGYLTILTFAGIVYKIWRTPLSSDPSLHNTRSGLGPWSDRIGTLAFGLTPLSILLSSRESILSLITGIPYESFNFFHRWLGHIILIQSILHTAGWCIVLAALYQPQPSAGKASLTEEYIIWGYVALGALFLLWILCLPFVIRRIPYEVWRKSHYLLALLYIVGCWGHWKLLQCFLIPSVLIWGLDRLLRLIRSALLHYNVLSHTLDGRMRFQCAKATTQVFSSRGVDEGDVLRLDFDHPGSAWNVGQHFFLTFPESTIWQSHPFTSAAPPMMAPNAFTQKHTYIFRARSGETSRVAKLVEAKQAVARKDPEALASLTSMSRAKVRSVSTQQLSVILSGPYGESIIPRDCTDGTRLTTGNGDRNVLCVAGGTGITYVLPVLMQLVASASHAPLRRLHLVWMVRYAEDVRWVQSELSWLQSHSDVQVTLFVTRQQPTVSLNIDAEEKCVDQLATTATTTVMTTTLKACAVEKCRSGVRDVDASWNGEQGRVKDEEEKSKESASSSDSDSNSDKAEVEGKSRSSGADCEEGGVQDEVVLLSKSSPTAPPRDGMPLLKSPKGCTASTRLHKIGRPKMDRVLTSFLHDEDEEKEGRRRRRRGVGGSSSSSSTRVFASGPSELIKDIRAAVAKHNHPSTAWRGSGGDGTGSAVVDLICDDRMEW